MSYTEESIKCALLLFRRKVTIKGCEMIIFGDSFSSAVFFIGQLSVKIARISAAITSHPLYSVT